MLNNGLNQNDYSSFKARIIEAEIALDAKADAIYNKKVNN